MHERMPYGAQPRTTTEQRWALIRLVLGLLQIAGATAALLLLAATGVTRLSLGIVVITGLSTTLSVLLFGSDRPRWERRGWRRSDDRRS